MNRNSPAFPSKAIVRAGRMDFEGTEYTNDTEVFFRGLTVRQYYKAAALQGLISVFGNNLSAEEYARRAGECADEMLNEDGRND